MNIYNKYISHCNDILSLDNRFFYQAYYSQTETHLEQLYTYDREHECQEECHQHDIVDGFNSNNHTLYNMLKYQDYFLH